MTGYQVLYRRFRPKTFSDIFGQDAVVAVLKNQILNNNISHAYLFSGSRGTGKTSTAKVFAKAVSCQNNTDGSPCGQCSSCRSFEQNAVMDIIEIDAASNRGIDEIRDLREKVSFLPSFGRYRIFIIDEVHMLTTEAFNALLKTLEEPPEHVIFIFATTDASKLPPTILSRCQRFDFSRISSHVIADRMKDILEELGIEYEQAALYLIAEKSDGALRDALSFLDKAISSRQTDILTAEDAAAAAGTAGSSDVTAVAEAVIRQSAPEALQLLDKALMNGIDADSIFSLLIDYFRSIMIYSSTQNPERILFKSEPEMKSYEDNSINIKPQFAAVCVKELSKAKNESKYLPNPRYLLEAAVLGLSDPGTAAESMSIMMRLERLEKRIEGLRSSVYSAPQKAAEEAVPERKEQAKPEVSEKREPASAPKQSADPQLSLKIQKEISMSGKIIQNRERNMILGDLFPQMKLSSFDGVTAYIYPTGEAVHMMEVFEQKNGAEKLARILSERMETEIRVEVTKNDADSSGSDIISAASEIFGGLSEFND